MNSRDKMPAIEAMVQRFARLWGLEIRRISRTGLSNKLYDTVHPKANYSPWNADEEFKVVYLSIRDHTLVDLYRCYSLWQLVGQAAKLGASGSLLEVGVWRGGTGALIASRARACGVESTVYLCDTFEGVVKAGKRDYQYRGGEHSDASITHVEQLVDSLSLSDVRLLKGVFPEETSIFLADSKLRFVHVDVDVYDSAKGVMEWAWPRLVRGGIVCFDDYGFRKCNGVTDYVNEHLGAPDRIVLHNLNGQAVVVKL